MNRQLVPGEAARELGAAGITIVRERTGDGTEIRCCCPACGEKTGHLYVSAVTSAAFCHKCELRTPLHALTGNGSAGGFQGRRYGVLAATAAYYHGRLSPDVRRYLTEDRHLSPEVLEQFQVGWADGGLRKHLLEEKGFPLEACLEAGVLKQDERGARDFFYHRIVFPNIIGGRAVHLSGRRLGDGDGPKWLHLPGEITYPYNADALRQSGCIWAEGILDVLSLACWGIPAVAGLGTHVKKEWTEAIPDANRITVCMDGDAAGRGGAMKAAQILGDRACIALLPAGEDPNDMLCEGRREEIEECLRQATDLLTFRIHQVPSDTARTELPRLLGDILRAVAACTAPAAEAYLGVITERFGLKREEVAAYRRRVKDLRKEAEGSSHEKGPADPIYSARFPGLVDLAEQDGEPVFLVVEEDGRLEVVRAVERDEQLLVPPPKQQTPWLLPRAEAVLEAYEVDTDGALWDDLVAYHQGISELPGEAHYEFIATWVMHGYLLESANYSPELCLFAVPERGKTRTGKGIIYVAYRGIHVESLRDAYIVRFADYYGGAILFDVMNLWRKAEREGSEDILLGRFERGFTVPRVLYPDRGPHRDVVFYEVFGPTLIGTDEPVHHILDARAVTFTMPPARRGFEADVTPEAARPLRERLVAFRARHLGASLPDADKPASGRLGDILRHLRQVILLARPEREQAFLAFVEQLRRDRLGEKADTLEAALLRALDGLRGEVSGGELPVRSVAELLNLGREERDRVSGAKVGKRLRSLGFTKGTRGSGGATIRWDDETLVRAMEAYGLREPAHPAHPSASAAGDGAGGGGSEGCVGCAKGTEEDGAHARARGAAAGAAAAPVPSGPCPNCHGARYWRHRSGGPWICAVCHPPALPEVVAEWADVVGGAAAATGDDRDAEVQ